MNLTMHCTFRYYSFRSFFRQIAGILLLAPAFVPTLAQPTAEHDLRFDQLATVWDEAIPLGNGLLGALVWEKDGVLRFSLDRSDLWDQRPMKGLHRKEFSFEWVQNQVKKNEYKPVQEYFDAPYDREPAPTKIPAGALQFSWGKRAKVNNVKLSIDEALCHVQWENGLILKTFVHATQPVGWFRIENIPPDFTPTVVAPAYQGALKEGAEVNSLVGDDLARLGYQQGTIQSGDHEITYDQDGWGGFSYRISVKWKKINPAVLEGVWSISSHRSKEDKGENAKTVVETALQSSFDQALKSHRNWWEVFWSRSSLKVPDPILEKQWYLEKYKFGSIARENTPPISLQAVWTADHGRIPPWKGDYHHDLNTQLSYWPAYSGNHLEEALGYLNHLDNNKDNYRRYTQQYFGIDGLNVPGVTTLDGTEMGGWIQYSLSPTVSAWLAHHYYLQWRYSKDRDFLKNRAYPWIKEVCRFLDGITKKDENGFRQLPLSSSPEINNNEITAWFPKNTHHDLALMRFAFQAGAELAQELGLKAEAVRWQKILGEFDDFPLTPQKELMIAPGFPYKESHRHLSHLMAIHPLGLIKWEDGELAQAIIKNSLAQLEAVGPQFWCGYSYSWLGSLQARAKNGEKAAQALRIFAQAFCLPNSFHANGDQTKSGYSSMTYRPFTLEGNMAFAAGLQEMLLQSYAGFIEIMPAIPENWQDVSFRQLRAEGAFLIDAERKGGKIREIKITSEKEGDQWLKLPGNNWNIIVQKGITTGPVKNGLLPLQSLGKGGELVIQFNP